jgi:hypothetical protein
MHYHRLRENLKPSGRLQARQSLSLGQPFAGGTDINESMIEQGAESLPIPRLRSPGPHILQRDDSRSGIGLWSSLTVCRGYSRATQ